MARFDEYFADAFTKASDRASQIAFEQEKLRQENDPEVLKNKMIAQMNAYRLAMGESPIGFIPSSTPTEQDVRPDPLGQRASYTKGMPIVGMGGAITGGMPKTTMSKGGISMSFGGAAKGDPIQEAYEKENISVLGAGAKKRIEEQQKAITGVGNMSGGFGNFLEQYNRSINELSKKYPDIGATGLTGKLDRLSASIDTWKEDFPETAVLRDMAKPFAQEIATSLEGRATDEDRRIWIDVFPNALTNSSEKNIRQSSQLLISMQTKLKGTDKDINDVVSQLYNSGAKPLVKIAEQFYSKYPQLKAKALGIPEGWEIVEEK